MFRYLGQRVHAGELERKCARGLAQSRRESGLGAKQPGACWIVDIADPERLLGNVDAEAAQTIARLEQALLSRIAQHEGCRRARDMPLRLRRLLQQRQVGRAHPYAGNSHETSS